MSNVLAWHVTAACTAADLDAFGDLADAHPDAQWEGQGGHDREGLISLRYFSGSPSMSDVATAAAVAVSRVFGSVIVDVTALTLYREVDGAVFDAARL